VLFVGQLVYYKGIDVLLNAAARNHFHVAVVGGGALENELRQRADALDISDRVHFLGRLDDDELVAAYHACDLFCLPSTQRSEAFGIVQLEAFAAGKPVVSTDLPSGVPWVNKHNETGLVVPPRDPEALAHAIARILNDSRLRESFGRHARERVCTTFTADRMAADTLAVYRDILADA